MLCNDTVEADFHNFGKTYSIWPLSLYFHMLHFFSWPIFRIFHKFFKTRVTFNKYFLKLGSHYDLIFFN